MKKITTYLFTILSSCLILISCNIKKEKATTSSKIDSLSIYTKNLTSFEKLWSCNTKLKHYLNQSYVIKDTTAFDFNNDFLTDFAIIVEDTTRLPLKPEDNKQLRKKTLLILLNIDNKQLKCIGEYTNPFQTNQQDFNWGTNNNDAFNEMSSSNNLLSLKFSSGGTIQSNEIYSFRFINQKWKLEKYHLESYDITDINQNGILNNIFIHEYNFNKNKKTSYTINNQNIKDSVTVKIEPLVKYLNEFNAWEGVVNRPI